MSRVTKYKRRAARKVREFATGQGISSKFFLRNFFAVGLLVIFSVGFIALRFDCVTSMERITRLNKEIADMRTFKQRERSRYMTLTRESSMKHTVDSLGLGLSVPEQFPKTIHYDD